MSKSYDLDLIVDCVKNLAQSSRCVICDKLEGSHLRYTCGHTACGECTEGVNQCLLCLTPPEKDTSRQAEFDGPLTNRVNNISALIKACQESFGIDVYKRQRISEQLKVEKELFPRCIQAPLTYTRKKSFNPRLKNKENYRLQFPGEQISPIKALKMEYSFNTVDHWLDQNEKKIVKTSPRKAFANLNVNQSFIQRRTTHIKRRADLITDKVFENSKSPPNTTKLTRKRTHFKSTQSTRASPSLLDNFWKPKTVTDSFGWTPKKLKKEFDKHDKENKNEKDESGIEVDDDIIVIDESPSQVVDKDQQAWLAVLEAEKNDPCTPAVRLECSEAVNYTDDIERTITKSIFNTTEISNTLKRVPFFKKSYLKETCNLCNNIDNKTVKESAGQIKQDETKVTIESNSFKATINMTTIKPRPAVLEKKSVSVQTEIEGIAKMQDVEVQFDVENKYKEELDKAVICSQDLFTVEKNSEEYSVIKNPNNMEKKTDLKNANEAKQIIIADSDNDDANESNVIQVTAEVHRSSNEKEYGVLAEIEDMQLLQRSKHSKRSLSPNSSNSSEKENYDPNRQKKLKHGKKVMDKKKRRKQPDILTNKLKSSQDKL